MGAKWLFRISCLPRDGMASRRELRLTATAQRHERGSYCILIASLGKDQHSQFKVRFLLNAYRTTVKSKSCKSNHRELGRL